MSKSTDDVKKESAERACLFLALTMKAATFTVLAKK